MRKQTGEVLTAARQVLEAQLTVVRDEVARLTAEERVLTHALSSIDGDSASSSRSATAGKRAARTRAAQKQGTTRSATRKASSTRRRRQRGASKSTADRVDELRGRLADGPKSRNDLAAALNVSPARVQQLLAELGSAVSSQPDPDNRRGKLWSLKGSGNGAKRGEADRQA